MTSKKVRVSTKSRRASLAFLKKYDLTAKNVNDYVEDLDNEVPLYTAIRIEDEEQVERILALNPDVFLGIKENNSRNDGDKKDFQDTAIGYSYYLNSCDFMGSEDNQICELLQNYLSENYFKGMKNKSGIGFDQDDVRKIWEERVAVTNTAEGTKTGLFPSFKF